MLDQYAYEILKRENTELGRVIRERRQKTGISQRDLYEGLCTKEVYLRLENGGGVSDELLAEQILSRMHLQYRLLDLTVPEQFFELKECRFHIDRLIGIGALEEAKAKMEAYRRIAPLGKPLHGQYLLWKEAQLLEHKEKERAGQLYREALELTMPVSEIECRMRTTKVVSVEELGMYLGYRRCNCPCFMEECRQLLLVMEEILIGNQMYLAYYFEMAFSYALQLQEKQDYTAAEDFCGKLIRQLNDGLKHFYLAQFYFLRAKIRMKLVHGPEELADIRQEFLTAYYTALSFKEETTAEEIAVHCKEEYGWHITGLGK